MILGAFIDSLGTAISILVGVTALLTALFTGYRLLAHKIRADIRAIAGTSDAAAAQLTPNGAARAAGTESLTTRDLLDKINVQLGDNSARLTEVFSRLDAVQATLEDHAITDQRSLDATQKQLAAIDGRLAERATFLVSIFEFLARSDHRPPRLEYPDPHDD